MMDLSEDQKLQIVLVELQERYNASHRIRERSTRFTLWISGMAIGLAWLLISQKSLLFSQRVALTLLVAALFAGTLFFILGLLRGFGKNREAMINSERALGMHDSGVYLEDGPLLPPEYSRITSKWSNHFYTLCVWLIVVAVSLIVLTWTCPDPPKNQSPKAESEQVDGGRNNG
jgi:hypothetical protein